MTDLSHYDLFSHFSLKEAACLAAGIEPKIEQLSPRALVIFEAMNDSLNYWRGNNVRRWSAPCFTDGGKLPNWVLVPNAFEIEFFCDSNRVSSVAEAQDFVDKSMHSFKHCPISLSFSRHELTRWFAAKGAGFVPDYTFRPLALESESPSESTEDQMPASQEGDRIVDPADLPNELQAANIAFRAVSNGHGDQSSTFKNRLTVYLQENFKDLGAEAIARIATVANPDKSRGRKNRSTE
jgi:hypothetical protein